MKRHYLTNREIYGRMDLVDSSATRTERICMWIKSDEYRVSDRVTLTPGTMFRATGGPYFKAKDGTNISMKSRGPYRFIRHEQKGRKEVIICFDGDNGFAVLPLSKFKNNAHRMMSKNYVNRPYKVTGRVLGSLASRKRKKQKGRKAA